MSRSQELCFVHTPSEVGRADADGDVIAHCSQLEMAMLSLALAEDDPSCVTISTPLSCKDVSMNCEN